MGSSTLEDTADPVLSKTQQRRAVRLGPRAVYARRPMDELMKQAGFEHVRVEVSA